MKLQNCCLLLLFVGSYAGPATRDRSELPTKEPEANVSSKPCVGKCKEFSLSYNFKNNYGKSVWFEYEAESRLELEGVIERSIKRKAHVGISLLGDCEYTLKVKVKGAEVTEGWGEALERSPLRFSLQKGVVSDVCPESSEAPWVVNVKRAILSAFHNSLNRISYHDNVFEKDINGQCPTEYERRGLAENGKKYAVVTRKKQLLGCRPPPSVRFALRSLDYQLQQESTSLLDSWQNCTLMYYRHKRFGRILDKVKCVEKHIIQLADQGSTKVALATTFLNLKARTFCRNAEKSEVGEKISQGVKFDLSEFEQKDSQHSAQENFQQL